MKFILAVHLDFEIEIDPESGQALTAEIVRRLACRRVCSSRPEQWKVPGVKSRWTNGSFSWPFDAEVVEVTPEMESQR